MAGQWIGRDFNAVQRILSGKQALQEIHRLFLQQKVAMVADDGYGPNNEATPWTPRQFIPVLSHDSEQRFLQKSLKPFFQFVGCFLFFALGTPEEFGRFAAPRSRGFSFDSKVLKGHHLRLRH